MLCLITRFDSRPIGSQDRAPLSQIGGKITLKLYCGTLWSMPRIRPVSSDNATVHLIPASPTTLLLHYVTLRSRYGQCHLTMSAPCSTILVEKLIRATSGPKRPSSSLPGCLGCTRSHATLFIGWNSTCVFQADIVDRSPHFNCKGGAVIPKRVLIAPSVSGNYTPLYPPGLIVCDKSNRQVEGA